MNLHSVAEVFAENFATRGEVGASVSIWEQGRETLRLGAGFRDRQKTEPWTADTPVLVWSATKGVAAGCALHAIAHQGLSIEMPVAEVWPEFAGGGKADVTIGEALSHQAGLAALSEEVSEMPYVEVIQAIERQAPLWPRGTGHGYHPRMFGYLADELVRRIAGMPLHAYWQREFATPLDLAFWIGVPEEKLAAVAPILGARPAASQDAFLRALSDPASLTARAFSSPKGSHTPSAMNTASSRQTPYPAFGGIGTASALGKYYAMLANGGTLDGHGFFPSNAIAWMETTLTSGEDRVLCLETAFSAGFMKDPVALHGGKVRALFGPSLRAFGQPGAGGSVAFADPENRLAFAYVMNQMEPGVLPNAKAQRMIDALYSER